VVKSWPSWVNEKEFKLRGLLKPIEKLCSWAFRPVFSVGWGVLANNPRIPVIHQAQLADTGSRFPLVIFSHGMGCNRYAYSKVCYDLCSEGFIVASVEHRDGSACHSRYIIDGITTEIPHGFVEETDHEYSYRNKQVHQRAKEVSMAADLMFSLNAGILPKNVIDNESGYDLSGLIGKIDTEDSYLTGHSFGGATALFTASKDDRFKGIVSIDPWMFSVSQESFRIHKPVMMINTENFVNKENIQKVQEVCEDLSARVLSGAVHLVHTDAPLLFENDLIKSGLGMGCSRSTEEVLSENHGLVHSWIKSRINGVELDRTIDFGIVD